MKQIFMWLCTCISIEIFTAVGVSLYLLFLGEIVLAIIATVIFAKIIIFHFIFDIFDKKQKSKSKIQENLKLS